MIFMWVSLLNTDRMALETVSWNKIKHWTVYIFIIFNLGEYFCVCTWELIGMKTDVNRSSVGWAVTVNIPMKLSNGDLIYCGSSPILISPTRIPTEGISPSSSKLSLKVLRRVTFKHQFNCVELEWDGRQWKAKKKNYWSREGEFEDAFHSEELL